MNTLIRGRTRSGLNKISSFRRLLQQLILVAVLWCILWILLSTHWIQRVDQASLSPPQMPMAFLPLTAYVESAHLYSASNDTTMLPLRTHGPNQLLKFTYPSIQSCADLPDKLPVFHDHDQDALYGPNVRNSQPLFDVRLDYAATTCPVDADPFLPWIHDVFPNNDGTLIEFIAYNKRRCNTDPNVFAKDLANLEPQVTLMQPVPVTRITENEVRSLAGVPKSLWTSSRETRYQLATSFDESTEKETRFICQFHRFRYNKDGDGAIVKQVVGETLSVFPYNYELANMRTPGSKPMLTFDANSKNGAHNEQVWNAVLHFSCPVPKDLQAQLVSGETVMDGSRPSLFLDLVPIRTRPRLKREGYFPQAPSDYFDPLLEWGKAHVLPPIESSGRWSHIPLCLPPRLSSLRQQEKTVVGNSDEAQIAKNEVASKDHFLIGCIWAAASYTTRGQTVSDTSTSARLLEWLTFHLEIAGFDHVFLYDNSGPSNNNATSSSSLESITRLFPGRVTRIPWSHRVCNNNKPSSPNAGERSSQYAAETSCRVRHGPNAEWMIFFDTGKIYRPVSCRYSAEVWRRLYSYVVYIHIADEYLIPQGKWNSIKQWLKEGVGDKSESHILSFYQSRAAPNIEFMEPDGKSSGCLSKRSNVTFLEAYDCESEPLPKPKDKWRAMKQIYRPWYVLNHFVHYSTVTKRILSNPEQASPGFIEKAPYERRVDEVNEAFMLHAKTTTPEATKNWNIKCHVSAAANKKNTACPVGIAFPLDADSTAASNSTTSADGMVYNCYRHKSVQELVPKLEKAMESLLMRDKL